MLDKNLIAAYQATHYKFHWRGREYVLEIGKQHDVLSEMFTAHKCSSAAYITPQNPFSRPMSAAENERLLIQFRKEVNYLGYPYFEGIGQDPRGEWPGEESLLILGITLTTASKLAEKYGQNAFVFCTDSYTPELVLRPYSALNLK
ncbi:MAG: Protein of unknown function (DUF3293) [Idiomarinaceae bacterium HL-53]|nr:MAG: Protein of unknown function (DUF3293) [Idiomarinaceae bacterium HL-53]CUS49185.1 Protein of unknown function (DUF3293) [Idiomarinaceae bacterium HL-53]